MILSIVLNVHGELYQKCPYGNLIIFFQTIILYKFELKYKYLA